MEPPKWALWLLSSFVSLASCTDLNVDVGACRSLGFNPSSLLCSSCDDLAQFSLRHLQEDCQGCCQDDGSSLQKMVKYPKAILEVQAFIKSDRTERYPGLTIKYVRGADPIIKLLDEEEDVVENLAIDKWNTDSVEEFLDLYLESAPANDSSAEEATP